MLCVRFFCLLSVNSVDLCELSHLLPLAAYQLKGKTNVCARWQGFVEQVIFDKLEG